MEKLKSFYEFLSITESLAKEGSEIPPDLTKSSAPYSSTSTDTTKEESPSTEIFDEDKYKDYGTDPLEISKDFQNIAKGGYSWEGGSSGMPIDIYFKSESPLFKKPSDGSTYCTGFTFAVGYVSCLNSGLLNSFTNADIIKMQKVWNQGDAKTYPKLCVDAIANTKYSDGKVLGEEVTIENVNPGDFCQIWRNTGYGHSVIVLEIVKKDGKSIGIKYYSSNTKINPETKRSGPGENTEYFTDAVGMGGKVFRNKTYFARISSAVSYIQDLKDGILN